MYPRRKSTQVNLTTFYNNQVSSLLGVQRGYIPLVEHEKAEYPAGTIVSFVSLKIPQGWLECNGQTVSRSMYPKLFEVLGTTYGSGDGITTFVLPDLRGAFLRGHQTNSLYPQYSGNNLNEFQTHATETHSHTITDPSHDHTFISRNDDFNGSGTSYPNYEKPSFGKYDSVPNEVNWSSAVAPNTTGITVNESLTNGNSDPNETRPFNFAVIWIIKV